MELLSVKIEKYRTIKHSAELTFDGLKVLIGANNRGKSNVLNAIKLGMDTLDSISRLPVDRDGHVLRNSLSRVQRPRLVSRQVRRSESYNWQRDYPLDLQSRKNGNHSSKIRFEFDLSEEDRRQFFGLTRSRNDGRLSVEIKYSAESTQVRFPKRGGSGYASKAKIICEFISSRLKFLYIPAIRTPDQAAMVIDQLIHEQLSTLAVNDEYRQLVSRIKEIENEKLTQVGSNLEQRMRTYLPGFVQLEVKRDSSVNPRLGGAGVEDIQVDDGVMTSLLEKGDGVKSLVTLALLHDLAERGAEEQEVLLAIDEPEAHLHPEAVHEMGEVLRRIAAERPVVIATHSQMLVNRRLLSNNIIVGNDQFEAVKRIDQVRACLGVRPFDNLSTAEFVILTEGPTDVNIITEFLMKTSELFRVHHENSVVVVTDAIGAGNIKARVQFAESMLQEVFVVVDSDQSGKAAIDALRASSFDMERARLLSIRGRGPSELEDAVKEEVQIEAFIDVTGHEAYSPTFSPAKVWSDRTRGDLRAIGVPTQEVESALLAVKKRIEELSVIDIQNSLTRDGYILFEGISGAVDKMLRRREGRI
ncbi:AAA family ATPase [Citricoccus nitrophenolicus]|uniref:AAA family ATPase n=1 Tax=Citricoccus nitrophenolicus TaxID=863575 RepID=A0ABV0IK50_9MICC